MEGRGASGPSGPPIARQSAGHRPKRLRSGRVASALFITAFVLGVLNAASASLETVSVSSPERVYGTGVCELAGEVRDASGAPVPNATVVVTDASLGATTDASGWYSIKGVSPGVHRVEATAPGYNRMSVRLELRAGLLKGLDFTLERGGEDAALDETPRASATDPTLSLLWAAPTMLALSICALGAALLSWRGGRTKLTLALGAASVVSFGFLIGSALAAAGAVPTALAAAAPTAAAVKKRGAGVPRPSAPVAPAAVECELVEEGGRGAELRAPPGPLPPTGSERRAGEWGGGIERLVRPRARTRPLCCVCVEEIREGEDRVRCVCGRSMHVRCVREPECPECGHPFRNGA